MMPYADRRREAARKGMAKLREARKKEAKALKSQIRSLQAALEHLKAHPQGQDQTIKPFAYAHQVLAKHVHAQRAQDLARKRFIQTFQSWTIPQQLYASYVEPRVSNDADSRRSAFHWLTSKAYNMSVEAERCRSKDESVDDSIQVKLHLGHDENGTCIRAIEYHLQFTIFANFENAAKTWWLDLLEASPLVVSTVLDAIGEHILYVGQEHASLKYTRLCLAGIVMDDAKDRITITQTGIAMDDRFPFQDGESRSNGFQWVVFQHVTDNVTLVRWSLLNFCPVNAKGPLSLSEMARNLRCAVRPNDSDESILMKIHTAVEGALENLRDQFRHRCGRFRVEPPSTMGSRNFSMESRRHIHT